MTESDSAAGGGGADFLQLDLADAPGGRLAEWLAGQVRGAVSDGRLPVGARLPATRVLAADLGVSRGVVTEAYRRLAEDGHVAGRRRGGTVVVAGPLGGERAGPGADPAAGGAASPGSGLGFGLGSASGAGVRAAGDRRTASATDRAAGRAADRAAGPAASGPQLTAGGGLFDGEPGHDVFDRLQKAPARFDLSPGAPDLAAFPRSAWLRAERAVLGGLPAAELGYGDPRGTPALRGAVADWLARNRGIPAAPEDVVVVAGTAQALGLLAQVLRAEGTSTVAFEEPGSLGVRLHLRRAGLATPPVPVDAHGVRVDALRATGAPAVLLTPAHQFPTGVVLGGDRRRALMAWAREGGLVVEDDYDAEHRYDRPPVAALRALMPDRVVYAGSVSKLLAPALRIGWMLVPPHYRDAFVEAKRYTDLGNATLPQLTLAALMRSGALERQLRLLRRRHRQRRDAMIAAVREQLPGAVVHGAAAGLHLTVTFSRLPGAVGDTALAAAALAHGVKLHPLSWHRQLPGPPGLVLGYAARTPTEIVGAVAVVGRLLRTT
nr:PLP-dependent aminotransferase family protein [Actinacidiphila epipremni]